MVDKNEPAFNVQKYYFFFPDGCDGSAFPLQMLPYFGRPVVAEQVLRDSWGKGISFTVLPDRVFLCLELLNLSTGMGGTCGLCRSLFAL